MCAQKFSVKYAPFKAKCHNNLNTKVFQGILSAVKAGSHKV